MRRVLTMAAKDLKLIARDWLGLFFIVGFPILMGVFFGAIAGSFSAESAELSVGIVDEDRTPMSERFVEALRETGNVRLQTLGREAAQDGVRRGRLVGMIAVPEGFGQTAGLLWEEGPAIQLGVDPSRPAEAGMLEGIILQAVGQLVSARFEDPAAMRPLLAEAQAELESNDQLPRLMRPLLAQMMESLDGFLESWEEVQTAEDAAARATRSEVPGLELARIEQIDVTRELPKDSAEAMVRQLRSKWDISFPQAMMWGVLASAAAFAITIVRERKQGTLLRLQVAPVRRGQILAGKGLACFITVIGVIVMMTVLGLVLGLRPRSPVLLAVAALCTALCFVGVMMLMSVIGKSEEAVSGAAWGANVIMAMLGGGMLPLAFMPGFLKTISNLSPVKWSILGLEGAIWRGFAWSEMLLPCAVQLLIGAVCLTAAVIILSRETQR